MREVLRGKSAMHNSGNRGRIEEYAERIGLHIESVTSQTFADIVRKAGAEHRNTVVAADTAYSANRLDRCV